MSKTVSRAKGAARFIPAKLAGAATAVVGTVMAGSAAAAGEITAALTESIDKSDLLAGGAIILGACAVVAMIGLGRRLAK